VADFLSIFERCVDVAPASDLEALLRDVPAKWVVYLFCDEADQPIQLLCVKNLRYSLRRRLSGEEPVGPTKRIRYRELVRRVYWRRVDSAFEADWVYLEAARQVFSQSYQAMVGFRPAWFVHVNPQANFPRYTKTTDLTIKSGELIGPVEDKHAAQRLIELCEDCFDLCRYYNILIEAPNGKACAYKEMGKCPAPCDGSIPIERYREMVERSARAILEPGQLVAELKGRMGRAAAAMEFEAANKIKARLEEARQLGQGAFRHARRLENFAFVSLQRGPRKGTAKVFLVVRGRIEEAAGLIAEPTDGAELLRWVLGRAEELGRGDVTGADAERVGLVANHLFSPKQGHGVWLRMDQVEAKALAKCYRELAKQKEAKDVEGEGITKELQAM
jgi:excinuclease UvrABC nuclease subunit